MCNHGVLSVARHHKGVISHANHLHCTAVSLYCPVNASIYWRITDVIKALYEVDVLPRAIADIALNALRSNIGTLELDNVLSERSELNHRIAAQLSETGIKWGILIRRVCLLCR